MASLQQMAARAARAEGIPVQLFLRLVKVESGFRPHIVSSAGAIGLTQLMPGTARGLGVDPWNPQENLTGGARYLKAMFQHFGSWSLALAAYNAGAGAVEQHGGIPPFPETQHYVSLILGGLKKGALTASGGSQRLAAPQMSTQTVPVPKLPPIPDFAQLAEKNLSEGANPFESLTNLTSMLANGGLTPSTETQTVLTPGGGGGQQVPAGKGATGIAQVAMRYIGTPYLWGGSSPKGFDCSGLLQYAAAKVGIHLARTTYSQWTQGRAVGLGQLQPGDAVFFRGSDSRGGLPGHVGIYIGHGKFIEAPHTGARVRIATLSGYPGYMGARRY